jgi:hypothetical protein
MLNQMNRIFDSIDNKHQIEINIIDNISWFNINKLDFETFKTFLILLKDVIIYMKKNKVNCIKQYIMEEDAIFFKKSLIDNLDNNNLIVSTNIDDFVDEIINVMGIKKI